MSGRSSTDAPGAPYVRLGTGVDRVAEHAAGHNFTAGLQHVAKLWDIRLMTLANFGYGACVNSMLGYVPLFLRNVGWAGPRADLAVSLFHVASLVATLPFSVWSDRSGHRRFFMLAGAISMSLATFAIPLVANQSVFAVMVAAGLMRDAFMSIMITRLMESEGVGPAYAGSAMGLSMVGMQLGGAVAPAAGNALAALGPGRPFQFWSLLALSGAALFWLVGDRRGPEDSVS
jgi:predicted MFS family arabinose efflux permease